jgi:large subunit ribosomal protein L17
MRHRKSINQLGRTSSHRKSMLANMATSLIMHKRIKTTVSKAKALRTFVEPLITKSKDDSTHSRRVVFSSLQDKNAVSELFREVAPKIGDRPGGYTRILKLDTRIGDNAEMCIIELVDFNVNLQSEKEDTTKGKSKRRRGTKKTVVKAAAGTTKSAKSAAPEIEEAEIVEDIAKTKTGDSKSPASETLSEEAKKENES